MRVWYDEAIAPDWPRMRALLDADVAYRAGPARRERRRSLFEQLHPSLRWPGDRVVSDDPFERDFDLRGRGLALSPSVFSRRRVLWNLLEDSLPAGAYPVRAVGTLGATATAGRRRAGPGDRAGRAALLTCSTRRRPPPTWPDCTGLSAGNVSQHLAALHAAGLVAGPAQGRHVHYRNTDAAAVLLRASRAG